MAVSNQQIQKQLQVDILTPDITFYSAKASSLVVPAEFGYMGILVDHAPLVCHVVPGRVTIREGSGGLKIIDSRGHGFMQVLENQVTLLLDSI